MQNTSKNGTGFCQADGSTERKEVVLNYKLIENVKDAFFDLMYNRQLTEPSIPNDKNQWLTAYEKDTKNVKEWLKLAFKKEIDIASLQDIFPYEEYAYKMENYIFKECNYGLAIYDIPGQKLWVPGEFEISDVAKEDIDKCFKQLYQISSTYNYINCSSKELEKLREQIDNDILQAHPELKLYKTEWKSLFYDTTKQCLFDAGQQFNSNIEIQFENRKKWCDIWIDNLPEENVENAIEKILFFLETGSSIQTSYLTL